MPTSSQELHKFSLPTSTDKIRRILTVAQKTFGAK